MKAFLIAVIVFGCGCVRTDRPGEYCVNWFPHACENMIAERQEPIRRYEEQQAGVRARALAIAQQADEEGRQRQAFWKAQEEQRARETEEKRRALLEEKEKQRVEREKRLKERDAQEALDAACFTFIQKHCTRSLVCETSRPCGVHGGVYMCWDVTHCERTGKMSCKGTPPTGCYPQ